MSILGVIYKNRGFYLENFSNGFFPLSQEPIKEERRRKERRMRICLTWFPISGLGEPEI